MKTASHLGGAEVVWNEPASAEEWFQQPAGVPAPKLRGVRQQLGLVVRDRR